MRRWITFFVAAGMSVSVVAGARAETRIYFCQQTGQYDPVANRTIRIDPVQVNFVLKDGEFSMGGGPRFNGRVIVEETEVTAFIDNEQYKGVVDLRHTGPATAEVTMGLVNRVLSQGKEVITFGRCRIQSK